VKSAGYRKVKSDTKMENLKEVLNSGIEELYSLWEEIGIKSET
jgi:hypothetical protein